MLYSRSIELRKLIEVNHPDTLLTIKRSQLRQSESKNKDPSIVEPLTPGSQVFIKSLKIENKLQPSLVVPTSLNQSLKEVTIG